MLKNQPESPFIPRFPEDQFLQTADPTPRIPHIWCRSPWPSPVVGGYPVFIPRCFVIALARTPKKCLFYILAR